MSTSDLIVPDAIVVHQGPSATAIDVAIRAWLDAKTNRSGSHKTKRAYSDALMAFRATLLKAGLDLDGEPRALALAAQGWAGRDQPAAATFNQRLAILSSFYAFARRRGLLEIENPVGLVERRRVHAYANAHPIESSELKRQIQQIDRGSGGGARDYALLAVLSQTGRRLSEVAALRWGDLHLEAERVTLHFRRAKGGKVMADRLAAPISKALLDWLRMHYGANLSELKPTDPIWISLAHNGSQGKALSTRSISNICMDRLGVSKVHTLRHTFARVMEDAGAKVSDIQARLGHESLATTGRYLAALRRAENLHADELARRMGFDEE